MSQALIKIWYNLSVSTNDKANLFNRAQFNAELVFEEQRYYFDFTTPAIILDKFNVNKTNITKEALLELHKDYMKDPTFLVGIAKPKKGHTIRLLDTKAIAILSLGETNSPKSIEIADSKHLYNASISPSQKQHSKSPDYYAYIDFKMIMDDLT